MTLEFTTEPLSPHLGVRVRGLAVERLDDSTFDENLARAQVGAELMAEKRAHDQAERDRAAVDEPVMQMDTQADIEAAALSKAEADQDADIEI